jgi:transposase
VFDAETVLVVWRARVACPTCGPKLEALDWLEPHARVTNRLAESVARMCKVMPIKRVAEHYGLHWGTVKDIDKAYLERTLEPARPGQVGHPPLLRMARKVAVPQDPCGGLRNLRVST